MRLARDLVPRIDRMRSRRRSTFPEIQDETFWGLYDRCKDFSLVHVTGFHNVYQSVRYIASNNLRGSFVECGCFLGGIIMFLGLLRAQLDLKEVEIIAFDTFTGPPIGSADIAFGKRIETRSLLPPFRRRVEEGVSRIVGSLDGYRMIEGLVEDTLPREAIPQIAFLRLDTDFYSSTSIELEYLYPRLVPGGVLIIDDYGVFSGSRRAVDEYFAEQRRPPLLHRIDEGVWAGVKP